MTDVGQLELTLPTTCIRARAATRHDLATALQRWDLADRARGLLAYLEEGTGAAVRLEAEPWRGRLAHAASVPPANPAPAPSGSTSLRRP
jgi:hypothetical protein